MKAIRVEKVVLNIGVGKAGEPHEKEKGSIPVGIHGVRSPEQKKEAKEVEAQSAQGHGLTGSKGSVGKPTRKGASHNDSNG